MANNPNQQEDVADYSGYFKGDEPAAQNQQEPQAAVSPLQELPTTKKFTRRALVLLIILIALVLGQIFIMWNWNRTTAPQIPDGYELVTPPDQPPYIKKIQ